ncbi:MAG: acetylornithine deacetylase [Candidatus Competibacteraceae bacterium]
MTVRELIARLVAFDTVSRNSNLALIDFIRDYLDGFGIRSSSITNETGDKANLYATIGPPVAGGVVLSGHTDVVPVDGQPWSSDPFSVVEREGRLYGRGTCDMKSFCAIALALVPAMDHLQKPIHLAFSYDEEIGCHGAPSLIRALLENVPRPAAVIVGEPTTMQLVTAHKGITTLRTRVLGHEAHSSQTHRGVSAVMTSARLIVFLDDLARRRQEIGPRDSGFEPGFTTVHVGVIRGGTAVNIISRHCEFIWDIRNLPGDEPQDLLAQFQDFCRHTVEPDMHAIAPETGIQTEIFASAPALRHEPESAAARLVKTLLGNAATYKVPYAAEAGQFQEAGLPAIICGPGSIDQAHQPDEFITLEQVEAGMQFIRRLIEHLSSGI